MILLDTNICIYIINAKPAAVMQRFRQYQIGEIGVCSVSLPRFQGQCLESCFYSDPMKTNDHNECLVYATPL